MKWGELVDSIEKRNKEILGLNRGHPAWYEWREYHNNSRFLSQFYMSHTTRDDKVIQNKKGEYILDIDEEFL